MFNTFRFQRFSRLDGCVSCTRLHAFCIDRAQMQLWDKGIHELMKKWCFIQDVFSQTLLQRIISRQGFFEEKIQRGFLSIMNVNLFPLRKLKKANQWRNGRAERFHPSDRSGLEWFYHCWHFLVSFHPSWTGVQSVPSWAFKGQSEIRWDSSEVSHWDIIEI